MKCNSLHGGLGAHKDLELEGRVDIVAKNAPKRESHLTTVGPQGFFSFFHGYQPLENCKTSVESIGGREKKASLFAR